MVDRLPTSPAASNRSPPTALPYGFAVTPSDAADVPSVTRAVYVGGGGNLAGAPTGSATVTFADGSGQAFPIVVNKSTLANIV